MGFTEQHGDRCEGEAADTDGRPLAEPGDVVSEPPQQLTVIRGSEHSGIISAIVLKIILPKTQNVLDVPTGM